MHEERQTDAAADPAGRRFLDGLIAALAPGARWRWIGRPEGKSDVADATLAAALTLPDGAARVLLVSNARFPDAVAEAVAKIGSLRARLSPGVAARLLEPLAEGRRDGRSYALFPMLAPIAEGGLRGRLEKTLVAPAVVGWLARLAEETRAPCPPAARAALFEAPLACVADEAGHPEPLRRAAERHLGALPERLVTVAEHGDFWTGNVLLAPAPVPLLAAARGAFAVIDWRGARLEGYPFADLLRFCMSSGDALSLRPRRAFAAQARRLGMGAGEVPLYVLAAIGRGGLDPGEFPRDRRLALARRMHAFLVGHGIAEAA